MDNIKTKQSRGKRLLQYIRKNRLIYLMMIPALGCWLLFKVGPLFGMVIAFQDYSPFKGILGSPFIRLENFMRIFKEPYMLTLIRNTVLLALYTLVFSFTVPVAFALFLNELKNSLVKKGVQSISFLPYFISSAVMVSILYTMVSPTTGVINMILVKLGMEPIYFMAQPGWFRPLYVILQIWQTCGYYGIIYMAAIMSIDPSIYEAASVDGASRWQKMMKITLPGIKTTVVVMLIVAVGNIFSVDLDRILLMYNPSVYETADVLQTYVYRLSFQSTGFPDYGYATAVNMVKSVIAFLLVLLTNKLSKKYAETRLF